MDKEECHGCSTIRARGRDRCSEIREDRRDGCSKLREECETGQVTFANTNEMGAARFARVKVVSSLEVRGGGHTSTRATNAEFWDPLRASAKVKK